MELIKINNKKRYKIGINKMRCLIKYKKNDIYENIDRYCLNEEC